MSTVEAKVLEAARVYAAAVRRVDDAVGDGGTVAGWKRRRAAANTALDLLGYAARDMPDPTPAGEAPKPIELVIRTIDDETEEYHIGGKRLVRANHDEHGWSGMAAVREGLTAMAEALGVPVRHEDGEEEGDGDPD